jgi:prepilin-type N-terminal cleavage/methylation domain-containing protein
VFTYNRGFTIIELLIAMSIAAFIMIGLNSVFNSVLFSNEHLSRTGNKLYEFQAFQRLITRDIRMMLQRPYELPPEAGDEERVFAMLSQNSLTFNKSIPVNIEYYISESKLYRAERLNDMTYTMRIPLLDNISYFKAEGYDGRGYREELSASMPVYKFTLTIDKQTYDFVAAKAVNATGE